MTPTQIYLACGLSLAILISLIMYLRSRPRKLDKPYYAKRWQTLQKHCADKKTWHLAITDADRLLDDVLKRRRYKGKTTGERLVSAQHDFSNNESLWFGHKMYNHITFDDLKRPNKQDTLQALGGFRQALKDLGALADKVVVAPIPVLETKVKVAPKRRPKND